jgi:hypothetical protein
MSWKPERINWKVAFYAMATLTMLALAAGARFSRTRRREPAGVPHLDGITLARPIGESAGRTVLAPHGHPSYRCSSNHTDGGSKPTPHRSATASRTPSP